MNNPENSTFYTVPHLKIGKTSPASVDSITLLHSGGDRAKLQIKIKRNLEIPLEEFTFKYRFASLTDKPDKLRQFRRFVYSGDEINTVEILTFDAAVPPGTKTNTCMAFVSEVKSTSGDIVNFEPGDFEEINIYDIKSGESEFSDTMPFQIKQAKLIIPEPSPSAKMPKPKRRKLALPIIIGAAAIIVASILAVRFIQNKDAERSVLALMDENRYEEAYTFTLKTGSDKLRRDVCREASKYYLETGDFELAFVFASGAPKSFGDEVAVEASKSLVDKSTGIVNLGAYRVVKFTDDDTLLSSALHSAIDTFAERGDYIGALRAAADLPDTDDRKVTLSDIFNKAVVSLLDRSDFDKYEAFLADIKANHIYDYGDSELINIVTAYSDSHSASKSLLYLAAKYPDIIDIASAEIIIEPEDATIRSAFTAVWPLLTTEQKRIFHSRRIAVDKELYIIDGGAVSGTEIIDAVSADTCASNTIILRADGSVVSVGAKTDYSKLTDVVQIAAGLNHSIFLHSDGRVSAVGDNSFGQCEVGAWRDIVSVAAGQNFTIGLKLDGSLVACGSNSFGQCEVSDLKGAIAVAAGGQTTAVMFSNGSIKLRGYRSLGLSNAESLQNVASIRVGDAAVLAKTTDDKFVLFTGSESGSFGDPSGWVDIDSFDVGSVCIAAVGGGIIYTDGDGIPVR